MDLENLTYHQAEAWYTHDAADSGLRPVALLVAIWRQLAALLMLGALLGFSSLRSARFVVVTVHLVILLAISGAFVKLPRVFANRMVNPFTWRPDAGFCRFHTITVQFTITALPLVVITIVLDTLLWVRHPAFYRTRLAGLRGRAAALCGPWLVTAAITLCVMLHTMPDGGQLVSGRCIPAFRSSRIVAFLVLVLLARFFLPLIGVVVSTVLLVAATRRHLRDAVLPSGVNSGSALLQRQQRQQQRQRRRRVLHACASVSVLATLYVLMLGPHYVQLILLRIPGIVGHGVDYHRLARIGSVVLSVHECFWNILPLLWAGLHPDILGCLFARCQWRRARAAGDGGGPAGSDQEAGAEVEAAGEVGDGRTVDLQVQEVSTELRTLTSNREVTEAEDLTELGCDKYSINC